MANTILPEGPPEHITREEKSRMIAARSERALAMLEAGAEVKALGDHLFSVPGSDGRRIVFMRDGEGDCGCEDRFYRGAALDVPCKHILLAAMTAPTAYRRRGVRAERRSLGTPSKRHRSERAPKRTRHEDESLRGVRADLDQLNALAERLGV